MSVNTMIGFLLLSVFAIASSFDELAMQSTKCKQSCPELNEPVCGSDGITYPSKCHIERTACLEKKEITITHPGACGIQSTKCKLDCPNSNEQVCGSDGNTYPSRCHVTRKACIEKKDIQIMHPGSCECPTSCLRNYKPVCAAYKGIEKTYYNICQFKKAHCLIKDATQSLEYKRPGPCKPMKSWKFCPTGCKDIWAPICGGDGVTYSSVCALKLTACRQKTKIKIYSIGKCGDGTKCPEFCPFNYKPTCGTTDGVSLVRYPSECLMKLKGCREGKEITRVPVQEQKKRRACKKMCVQYCPDVEQPVCGPDNVTYMNVCVMKRQYCLKKMAVKKGSFKFGPCDKMPNNTPIKKKK